MLAIKKYGAVRREYSSYALTYFPGEPFDERYSQTFFAVVIKFITFNSGITSNVALCKKLTFFTYSCYVSLDAINL